MNVNGKKRGIVALNKNLRNNAKQKQKLTNITKPQLYCFDSFNTYKRHLVLKWKRLRIC